MILIQRRLQTDLFHSRAGCKQLSRVPQELDNQVQAQGPRAAGTHSEYWNELSLPGQFCKLRLPIPLQTLTSSDKNMVGGGERVQLVNRLPYKRENLSSIPGTHVEKHGGRARGGEGAGVVACTYNPSVGDLITGDSLSLMSQSSLTGRP